MSSGFFRGIWITLRAANYTSQAMNDASKGLNKVQQAQVRLAKSSVQLGLMYVAMGAMAVQGLVGVMQFSERGKQVMTDFMDSIQPSLIKLGNAVADVVEPFIPLVTAIMGLATANPIILQAVAAIALFGSILLIGAGIINAFKGGIVLLGNTFSFLTPKIAATTPALTSFAGFETAAIPPTLGLAAALKMVAIAAGAGFVIFFALQGVVGSLPAALFGLAAAFAVLAIQMWLAAGAISVLSWGAAAIAGGAALAGAIAVAGGVTGQSYKSGTTFARNTGLAMIHQGEVIYNPATGNPREVFNDMNRKDNGRGSSSMTVVIEKLYTKSEEDELDERFARIGRNNMQGNR